jgi:hypothetical protein
MNFEGKALGVVSVCEDDGGKTGELVVGGDKIDELEASA